MILFKKAIELRNYLDSQQKKGKTIGFVPTMGALHEGHISLVGSSKKGSGMTVSSIFINPTQFNDPNDFKKYPVTLEADMYKLESAGCDVLFLPGIQEIYPDGTKELQHYELGYLETILEGKYRPGHFQGVCQVVHSLLEIVKPDSMYLGQKDYQQCMVINELVSLIDMEMVINICPTLREPDGLAMSSRNMRLTQDLRKKAATIFKALTHIKDHFKKGETGSLQQEAVAMLEKNGFKVDYVEIADAINLEHIDEWDGKKQAVALIAAFLGEVRLIDNLILN